MTEAVDTRAYWLRFNLDTYRMPGYHQRLLLRYMRHTGRLRTPERFATPTRGFLDQLAGYALRVDPNVPRRKAFVLGDITVNGRPTVVVNGLDFEHLPTSNTS
jgi:hypothetical protein